MELIINSTKIMLTNLEMASQKSPSQPLCIVKLQKRKSSQIIKLSLIWKVFIFLSERGFSIFSDI